MNLLYYSSVLIIFLPFIQSQTTESLLDLISSSSSTTTTTTSIINSDNNSINKTSHVTILGILSTDEHIDVLHKTTSYSNKNLSISSQSIVIDSNPLITMSNLCTIGNISYAKMIITGKLNDDEENDLILTAIAYVAEFYRIPLITIASRENIFSDNTLYNYMIRLVPPYLYEADAWFRMIRELKYTKVVLIYSQQEQSRMVISRFQMLTDDSDIQIERIEEYDYDTNFTSLLINLTVEHRVSARVFIIHPRLEDVDELLSAIKQLQLLENYAWIINEHTLISNRSTIFDGILGVRLHESFNEKNLLNDASQLILKTFTKFLNYSSAFWSPTAPIIDCSSTIAWSYGKEVYRTLITTEVLFGQTGYIGFNEDGDRIQSLYDIINIQNSQAIVVGSYRSNTSTCKTSSQCREIVEKTDLKLNQKEIIWPSGFQRKPDGVHTRRNVSVVTIAEKPFIFTRHGNDCDPITEVLCPQKKLHRNATDPEYDDYCCSGYCIALLQELSKNLSFVYTVHLVADGKYGSFDQEGDDKHKRWDGMIGELVNYAADMIIAPLTMNPERAEDIEFTKPFKYQGITILVRKTKDTSNLSSFLRPFKEGLWIMVLLSVHAVAVVLFLLDRYSPLGRLQAEIDKKNRETDEQLIIENNHEKTLNFTRALWFTWGVLLNSGIGEGTPTSFSARVLGMVWAGFAMIMVASYTANLAAFLVLDRPEEKLSGINDARLRNPQDTFIYATVKGSSVDMYFKRQVELSTMYRTMESKNYLTPEEAIADLRTGKLHAFIWDSPRLEYEAGLSCDLVTVGESFGRSSYGIALRKKDPWINPLSHAILSLHERGFMELLDNQWIFSKHENDCSDRSSSPATLGFHNMLDVFLLITGGVISGLLILFLEIILKRHKERKEVDNEISRSALGHWKKRIERRKHTHTIDSDFEDEKLPLSKIALSHVFVANKTRSPSLKHSS